MRDIKNIVIPTHDKDDIKRIGLEMYISYNAHTKIWWRPKEIANIVGMSFHSVRFMRLIVEMELRGMIECREGSRKVYKLTEKGYEIFERMKNAIYEIECADMEEMPL